jgi:hypothetical protein
MKRPRLSVTSTGQEWIAQFDEEDRPSAAMLLNKMLLLNEEEVSVSIRGLLQELAESRAGLRRRIGLYAEREYSEAAAFESELVSDGAGRMRRRAVGRTGPAAVKPRRGSPRVGSEGFIAFIISQAAEAWPTIYANHPGPDRIRTRKPISSIVIVTDFIGSGTRAGTMLDKFWNVPSVKAWVSRGWLDFKVVAAAGTETGISTLRAHRVQPQVLVENIAPTIFDSGSRKMRAGWSNLINTYGPDPSARNAGFADVGALIAFTYRIPNNVPALVRTSGNGWRALYEGPAPEELRAAFGLQDPVERLNDAAAAIGIELGDNLKVEEAELVLALTAIGIRWSAGKDQSVSELTGFSTRKVALIRHQAVQARLLRADGRLTDAGQALKQAGVRIERKRPTIPTSKELYYPMQLRVPR